MLDITDRKRAEEQALAAEERFRTLAEQGLFVVYQYELEHADPPAIHMSYLSPAAGDLLDVSSSVWAGDLGAWLELVHPDDVDEVTAIADEAFRTGNPWNHVFRMIAATAASCGCSIGGRRSNGTIGAGRTSSRACCST